ncbi:SLBB domain-containing protein [bacterium]|nr:SLBB domain-containing protein [bacterium]
MKKSSGLTKGFVVVFLIFLSQALFAQQGVYPRAARYYLGTENELLIPVNVWGFVKSPGQYMVPNNTDLLSLLSYAGGPLETAKINKIVIVRSYNNMERTIIPVNVKKYLKTGDERLIPVMKPGDTVIVKGTTFHWIQKFISFLGGFAVFAQILYFVAIAQERLK